jgi:hypothetical protein
LRGMTWQGRPRVASGQRCSGESCSRYTVRPHRRLLPRSDRGAVVPPNERQARSSSAERSPSGPVALPGWCDDLWRSVRKVVSTIIDGRCAQKLSTLLRHPSRRPGTSRDVETHSSASVAPRPRAPAGSPSDRLNARSGPTGHNQDRRSHPRCAQPSLP